MSTIYHDVLDKLGVKPGQLLYIVDADVSDGYTTVPTTKAIIASSAGEAERLFTEDLEEDELSYSNLVIQALVPGLAEKPHVLLWDDLFDEQGDD